MDVFWLFAWCFCFSVLGAVLAGKMARGPPVSLDGEGLRW